MQTTIPFDNEKSYMILPEISLFFILQCTLSPFASTNSYRV